MGLMRGIKIPPQDFALKRQGGGAYGVFARHYGIGSNRHSGTERVRLMRLSQHFVRTSMNRWYKGHKQIKIADAYMV